MEIFWSSSSRSGLRDAIDILVVAFIIYHALLLVKGTRGWQMTLGIVALVFFYYLTQMLQLRAVEWLLANFFAYFIFALIVIFQSELRRALAEIGKGPFFQRFRGRQNNPQHEAIALAASSLSEQNLGSLIVLEGEIGLRDYVEKGVQLDAVLTYDLLVSIFNPKSPLHDGAVIVQGDRISAAGCFLPITHDPQISRELGTRHRAAIGITEETDAVAIVVSEETGSISMVMRGKMVRNLDTDSLVRTLRRTPRGLRG